MRARFEKGLLFVLFALPAVCGAQSSGCYSSTTDTYAVRLLSFARLEVGSTDSTQIAARATAGTPTVDSTKVVITTDARTCSSVVAAINAYRNTPGAFRRVQIATLAHSGFLAFDGFAVSGPSSGSNPVYYITKQFQVKSVLLGL